MGSEHLVVVGVGEARRHEVGEAHQGVGGVADEWGELLERTPGRDPALLSRVR